MHSLNFKGILFTWPNPALYIYASVTSEEQNLRGNKENKFVHLRQGFILLNDFDE
jgi:hypothetical protein